MSSVVLKPPGGVCLTSLPLTLSSVCLSGEREDTTHGPISDSFGPLHSEFAPVIQKAWQLEGLPRVSMFRMAFQELTWKRL